MKLAAAIVVAVVLAGLAILQMPASAATRATSPAMAASTPCENLASVGLPHARIDSAEPVAAGAFVGAVQGRGAGGSAPGNPFANVPAFCRVRATLTPSSDSDIKAEVWMPASNWNGKYQAVGGGGWAGTISYSAMGAAVRAGYATASTDTGHAGGTADFALGHPEKLIDFGYRAIHETTAFAKPVVTAFYSAAPRVSFFNGCSTGDVRRSPKRSATRTISTGSWPVRRRGTGCACTRCAWRSASASTPPPTA